MENTEQLTDFLLQTMRETKTFAAEQAPEVAKEMLSYGLWDAKLGVIFCTIMLLSAIAMAFGWKYAAKKDYEGWMILASIGTCSLALFGSVGLICNYSIIKKIELAPKAYIIEKLTHK